MIKKILLILFLPSLVFAQNSPVAKSFNRSVSPTVDTAIYASGELLGGKLTISNAAKSGVHSGVIGTVIISDLDSDSADIDVVYFKSNPTGTTFTDQAAFDVADADLTKIICVVPVTDYFVFNDNSIGIAQNANCPFDLGDETTMYAALVSRGTPDYAAATDLTLTTSIYPDY